MCSGLQSPGCPEELKIYFRHMFSLKIVGQIMFLQKNNKLSVLVFFNVKN